MSSKERDIDNSVVSTPVDGPGVENLLASLREIIHTGRQKALHAVDTVQIGTGWSVGRHIVEFEQGGAERAEYGTKLLPRIAVRLTAEFGKGFDERNLWHMCRFYRTFPILNALRPELSWTHFRSLLRVEDSAARIWYMNEAADQNWNTRALDRQIRTLYYERLLASKYKLVLPSEEELRAELVKEQLVLEEQAMDSSASIEGDKK